MVPPVPMTPAKKPSAERSRMLLAEFKMRVHSDRGPVAMTNLPGKPILTGRIQLPVQAFDLAEFSTSAVPFAPVL